MKVTKTKFEEKAKKVHSSSWKGDCRVTPNQ